MKIRQLFYQNKKLQFELVTEKQKFSKDLTFRFKIKPVAVSRIFRSWLPILAEYLQQLILWSENEALRKHLPKSFKKFQKCVSTIDCTEIFIEGPLNLNARAQTWSNYKNHNTVKYLISITPVGAISFISKGWGGKVSDKDVTINSGYLDKFENVNIPISQVDLLDNIPVITCALVNLNLSVVSA